MLFQEHKITNKNFSEDENPYTVTEISLIIKQYVESTFQLKGKSLALKSQVLDIYTFHLKMKMQL